jgi:hypothetical protein
MPLLLVEAAPDLEAFEVGTAVVLIAALVVCLFCWLVIWVRKMIGGAG